MASSRRYEATFLTATILEWKFLLKIDKYKNIIIESLRYFVENGKAMVHAFVIMDNHLHLIWHINHPERSENIQRNFLKFTAQTIIADLRLNNPELLKEFYTGTKDRTYQIWQRKSLSVELWTEEVLRQKINYIHSNPVRAGICEQAAEYKYSTAGVYEGNNNWEFVTPFYFTS